MKVIVIIHETHKNMVGVDVSTSANFEMNVDRYEDVIKDPVVIETAAPIVPVVLARKTRLKKYNHSGEWTQDGDGWRQTITIAEV